MRILVVRNDKIGDFMLAWPAFAVLKQSLACHITAFVPAYTAPLAELCPWIDEVLIDPGSSADASRQMALISQLRAARFDACICFFSNMRNALLMWRANIPYRLAPATKLAQFLYTKRVTQRRSQSIKPEYLYNLELAAAFVQAQQAVVHYAMPPYLRFTEVERQTAREALCQSLALNPQQPWIMLHAGTGGSANNLSLTQYAALVVALQRQHAHWQFILTAGPNEAELAQTLAQLLQAQQIQVAVLVSRQGLIAFCQMLANADVVIAGSTGPLHIAATLDVPTVGFFHGKRSAKALRWKTLNSEGRHLAISAAEGTDMTHINPEMAAQQIVNWALPFVS